MLYFSGNSASLRFRVSRVLDIILWEGATRRVNHHTYGK